MSLWTKEQATTYFETGVEPPPPWQPEPYLMSRLDSEGLGHLKEPLREQTVAGLVELMKTDRPKFLPTLQKLGVTKLPDRQKVRDIINFIANPPMGSEDKLREEYSDELAKWPYAVVQGEKYIVDSEVEVMVRELPTDRPLKKYMIRSLSDTMKGVQVSMRRAQTSGYVGGTSVVFDNGEMIVGDDESWAVEDANLRVHVYVPNKVQPSMGYLQGWVNFIDLVPLDAEGNPPVKAPVSDYAIQRKIQNYFEDGYYQLSLCRAIQQGITERPEGMSFRQALDLIYMKVRGPALIKLGYMPTTKGLNEYMNSRYSGDDYSDLDEARYKELIDAHNRIVALMGGQDPRFIPDALAMRRQGQTVDMGSAFEAEPDKEDEDGEENLGEEGAQGNAEASAMAPAAEVS